MNLPFSNILTLFLEREEGGELHIQCEFLYIYILDNTLICFRSVYASGSLCCTTFVGSIDGRKTVCSLHANTTTTQRKSSVKKSGSLLTLLPFGRFRALCWTPIYYVISDRWLSSNTQVFNSIQSI